MLHDHARIFVAAGTGGDGCMSFRREAHVPKGGPDGGDAGRGGDVVLVCDDSLRDLQSFRRRTKYKAAAGGHGQGNQRHGADGATLEVRVPPGTVATLESGLAHDLVTPGQRAVLAAGGSGGHGNKRFATPTRQAPSFAERGLTGEEGWVELQLKLLADVGLVGLPNAGKSSLLSRITRADPKVANYPFTTLSPVLGTLEIDERQLVIADIPGLIEGASTGAGLGHEFLAHVERCRLLVHVLDLAPLDGTDPRDNFATIENELREHDPGLAALPRLLALSKADLVTPDVAQAAAGAWRSKLGADVAVLVTSSVTREGLESLGVELARRVRVRDLGESPGGDLAEHVVYRPARGRGFSVEATEGGTYRVVGQGVDRLVARFDLENDEALSELERRLRKIGVISALEAKGFQAGDEVEISGIVFDLHPGAPL